MCEKLNDPVTAPKTYYKKINRFLNNKKIPAMPPLLVYGEIISNFSQKAFLFNNFFCVSMYSITKFKQSAYFLSENR